MRKVPKIKTMCSRQDFLFTGCRTFQSVYFTPNFHTTFELQGLKEPFNPVPDFSTRFPNCSNKNLSLKSSQNKKDLNDVTAAQFLVSFSQLPAANKTIQNGAAGTSLRSFLFREDFSFHKENSEI